MVRRVVLRPGNLSRKQPLRLLTMVIGLISDALPVNTDAVRSKRSPD